MDRYDRGVVLGRGTFGSVFKAVDKTTGASVAIKRIDAGASGASAQGGRGGLDMTALREVKLLRELKPHPNVVPLLDVFLHKRRLCLVFEFVDSDLEAVIRAKGLVLSPGDVKAYAQALLRALAFCHASWVLHRDVKPNNLLVGADGEGGAGGLDGGRGRARVVLVHYGRRAAAPATLTRALSLPLSLMLTTQKQTNKQPPTTSQAPSSWPTSASPASTAPRTTAASPPTSSRGGTGRPSCCWGPRATAPAPMCGAPGWCWPSCCCAGRGCRPTGTWSSCR